MTGSSLAIRDHIVILGWSDRVRRIIRELRDEVHRASNELKPILIVTPDPSVINDSAFEHVYFIYGKITDRSVLKRANLSQASMLLIPTVYQELRHADGETVFSLLSALSVNPSIRVCVELGCADNGITLEEIRKRNLTHGDVEIVSFESICERLLAQCTINRGVTRVYDHLLSFSETTNEIYVSDLSEYWHGKTFRQVSAQCFEEQVIVLGFEREAELFLNPQNRDMMLQTKDRIWFMAFNKAAGLKVLHPEYFQK